MKTKLNIGSYNKTDSEAINLDKEKFNDGIDIVHNLEKFPYPFKDETFEEINIRYVLEHIDSNKTWKVMDELHRICKDGAVIKIHVPFREQWYRCLDHKRGFTQQTFKDLCWRGNETKGWANKKAYKMKKLELIPSHYGSFIPFKRLRILLSSFLNGVVSNMSVELIVIKKRI